MQQLQCIVQNISSRSFLLKVTDMQVQYIKKGRWMSCSMALFSAVTLQKVTFFSSDLKRCSSGIIQEFSLSLFTSLPCAAIAVSRFFFSSSSVSFE